MSLADIILIGLIAVVVVLVIRNQIKNIKTVRVHEVVEATVKVVWEVVLTTEKRNNCFVDTM